MGESNKISDFLKKITDEQSALRRLPLYFFLICVLLVVLIFKIGETNKKLEIIAENAGAYIGYETKANDPLEIYSEETKGVDDYIFQFESETESEIKDESSTENSPISGSESSSQKVTAQYTESSTKEKTTSASNTGSTPGTTQKSQENPTANSNNSSSKTTYVINTNSKKIHKSNCSYVSSMNDSNKLVVSLTDAEHSEYLSSGYTACSRCGG
ncbi:MAG: hypothetical protein J1F23_08630 [Oscillospiraceae bacterium]|nr:hypothetical protein [Oscillospiraceae bacterium]